MPYYFQDFPKIPYDIDKKGNTVDVTNIFVRYKIIDIFKKQQAVYYEYSVKDGERPDVIAAKYYEDASLDWIILLVNNIIDPQFDWPLDNRSFKNFIAKKYGSMATAMSQTHHYEQITQQQDVTFDGKIIPEEFYEIDLKTYNALADSEKRIVTSYTYEERINEAKRDIKLLSVDHVFPLLSQVRESLAG